MLPSFSTKHARTNRKLASAAVHTLESLEPRRLFCALHAPGDEPIVELRPDLIGVQNTTRGGQAFINWVNRGQANDRFAAVFGTNAGRARSVVDRVITDYMQMIQSFNYSDGSTVFNLTVTMDTAQGLGGAANLSSTLGGKPKAGSLTLLSGDDGSGSNWFLDPDAALNFDSSEFEGNIVNPFAGDAPSGSPLEDQGDFYTVVAAEMAHCLGLFGGTGAVPLWDSHTTNTGTADNAEGGGTSNFWTFTGPSVRHLMTGFNAGTPSSFNGAVHSSGGTANITFASTNWRGTEDAGNAVFELGRRYLVPDILGLMFHDAYGYTVAPAGSRDSFHSVLNRSTGELLIRGGSQTLSSDDISITRSGSNLVVSVDVGNDVPGSGSLPGAGNLPAYTTDYFVGDITSIRIVGDDGDDDILLDSVPASVPVTIDAGAGNDVIRIGDTSNTLNNIDGNVTVFGGLGTNTVRLEDSTNDLVDDTYTFDVSAGLATFDRGAFPLLSMSAVQFIDITTSSGFETFNINRLFAATDLTIHAGAGDDTVNISPLLDNLDAVQGDVSLPSETGTDTINLFDTASASNTTFTLTNGGVNHVLDRLTFGSVSFGTGTELVNLSTGIGIDNFRLDELNSFTTLTINAGGGPDHMTLAQTPQSINLLDGPIVFNGEAGTDDIVVNDQLNSGISTYTFSSDTLDRAGFGALDFAGAELLTLNGGSASNTYDIDPVGIGLHTDVTVNAGPANDAFRVTPSAGSMQNVVDATLTFNGGGGTGDSIALFDGSSSVSFPYSISTSAIIRGISPVNYSGVEDITINGATGNNDFTISTLTADVTLNAGAGNDRLFVGGTAQNLDNIDGLITFNGDAGTDSMEMRDQQHAAANSYAFLDNTFDTLGFSFLTYNTAESLTVQAGSGANSYSVFSIPAGVNVTINGGALSDTFNLGTAQHHINTLAGPLTLNGNGGTDSVTFDDAAEASAFGFTVTSSTVARGGMATVSYGTIETLTVSAGNVAGSLGKLHNIESTAAGTQLTLNAGSGNDSVRLSPTSLVLGSIAGNVALNGQGGTDALVGQDQNDGGNVVFTITPTTLSNDDSGTITYGTMESFTLNAGGGSSDIDLFGTAPGTPLIVNAGAGNDSINFNNLSTFAAAVTANGNAGADTIFVNDEFAGADSYTLSGTSLTRTGGFAGLTYATADDVVLLAETGNNAITVTSTNTTVTLDTNAGTDSVAIVETVSQGDVLLVPNAGNDNVSINADGIGSASALVESSIDLGSLNIGAGGFFTVFTNGSRVLRTTSLSVAGRLDLADNTIIVDYTGASPLASIRAALASGYAGGAWNGVGISSSNAAVIANHALGFAEASAIFSTFPAAFAGQNVDNTSVLVRYTRYGDANLDRTVNLSDFNRMSAGFGSASARWDQGDFNFDGTTNLLDFNLLASNFGLSAAASRMTT